MGESANRHISRVFSDSRALSQRGPGTAREEQARTRELLGQVLVDMGILAAEDANFPLAAPRQRGAIPDPVKIAAGERQLLGTLLVQSGHITNAQLDHAIAEQQRSGDKLGEVFTRCGMLTGQQLKALLDFQLDQEVAHDSPLRLGELLVATGHITREQLQDALRRQTLSHRKLGEELVEAGYIRPSCIKYGIRLQKMLINAALAAIISLGVTAVGDAAPTDPASKVVMQQALTESGDFSCLSSKEGELFRLVNEYRESNGLPPIANSRSLNKVARVHVIDLVENAPATGRNSRGQDCTLHSWSEQGSSEPMCYTNDHSFAEAMWDKPREITELTYTGDGYENAYATSEEEVDPVKVLNAWKSSPGHNAILLESGNWRGSNLLAFGVGIYKNHAVMWVGSLNDPLGPMQACGPDKTQVSFLR